MLIKFCEKLLAKIRETQVSYAERLTSGTFKNFEEYRHYVGKLEGMKEAEDIVKTVYDNIVNASRAETQGEITNGHRDTEIKFY